MPFSRAVRRWLKVLGPGFITGASDDDPSGIATYAQTGAQFGYAQLWTALFATPFMIVIQEMCGRLGLVKGRGLAALIRTRYGKGILWFAVSVLLIANAVNIGADLGAMAAVMQMLVGWPFAGWLIFITAVTLLLEVFVSYRAYAGFLKYLTLSLLTYVLVAFIVRQPWLLIGRATFMPSISWSKEYLFNLVAIFGTTISPYLFFWQASEEVEEEVLHHRLKEMDVGRPRVRPADVTRVGLDTVVGMVFSNLIMFFVIIAAASTLGAHGLTNIATPEQAAEALRPLAGDFAYALFALGIIGTGLLAVPVLAGSASYAIAEALGWKSGLYKKFKQAHGFYGVITIATLIGLLVNFTPVKPFQLLYDTAALNGILAPALMVIIIRLAGDKKVMGKYVSSKAMQAMGWIVTAVMGACAIGLIIQLFLDRG